MGRDLREGDEPSYSLRIIMAEIRHIPGFPDYFADSDGNIWSCCPLRGQNIRPKFPRLLKCSQAAKRYRIVGLKNESGLIRKYVHEIILEVFVGNRPKGMLACHGEKGSWVNSVDNLSWGTVQKNNVDDKLRDGTMAKGEKIAQSKLKEHQVLEIRNLKGKYTHNKIAEMYNIGTAQVTRIMNRQRWAWL